MVLFMDGFSHYQLSDLLRKWTSKTDAWATWSLPTEGRNGKCIKRTSISNQGYSAILSKGPDVNQAGAWTIGDRGICGFACKVDDLSRIAGGGAALPPIGIGGDISNTLITVIYGPWGAQLGISLNTDGTLSLYRGGAGPLATSVSVVQSGSWFFFECKWIIHQTTGTCVVRVNNIEVINYSGPLLSNSKFSGGPLPAALWSSVDVLGLNSSTIPYLVVRMCDFYLSDWVAPNGNFLGDIVVSYIIPDAAGANAMWAPPVGAATNWQAVNEVPPNDDTSYIQTLAIGNKDSYSFTPVTVNPLAIQHCICARRIVPGSASLQALSRQGGAENLATAQAVANETYKYNLFPFDTNPFTGIRWTQAEMNADEFGVLKAS